MSAGEDQARAGSGGSWWLRAASWGLVMAFVGFSVRWWNDTREAERQARRCAALGVDSAAYVHAFDTARHTTAREAYWEAWEAENGLAMARADAEMEAVVLDAVEAVGGASWTVDLVADVRSCFGSALPQVVAEPTNEHLP